MTEPVSHTDDTRSADALLQHADRFWSAEVENAERYSKQIRLLTTLAATLVGLILLRASTALDSVIRGGEEFPFKIAALVWAILTFGVVVLLQLSSMREKRASRWLLLCTGLLFVFTIAVCGALNTIDNDYASHALAGVSIGLGFSALLAAANCLYKLLLPSQDAILSEFTASRCFLLSARTVQLAENCMQPGEWSTFARTYRSAYELQKRNGRLRKKIQNSQKDLRTAILLSVVALVMLLVAVTVY